MLEFQAGKATECSKLSGPYCESWVIRVLRETQSMEACEFSEGREDSVLAV